MRGKVLKEIRLLIIISTSHTHSGSVARMKINELPWELFYAPLWLVRIIFNKRFIHQLPIDDDLLFQLIKRKQLNVTLHAVISSYKSCLFIFLISTHKQKNIFSHDCPHISQLRDFFAHYYWKPSLASPTMFILIIFFGIFFSLPSHSLAVWWAFNIIADNLFL